MTINQRQKAAISDAERKQMWDEICDELVDKASSHTNNDYSVAMIRTGRNIASGMELGVIVRCSSRNHPEFHSRFQDALRLIDQAIG